MKVNAHNIPAPDCDYEFSSHSVCFKPSGELREQTSSFEFTRVFCFLPLKNKYCLMNTIQTTINAFSDWPTAVFLNLSTNTTKMILPLKRSLCLFFNQWTFRNLSSAAKFMTVSNKLNTRLFFFCGLINCCESRYENF